MDTRRLLITLALCFVVLTAWSLLTNRLFPPPPEPPPPAPGSTPVERTEPAPGPVAESGEEAAGAPAEAAEAPGELESTAPPPPPGEEILTDVERKVVVENDRFRAELSNRGAVVTSFQLKHHESHGGGEVDLVRRRESAPYPFGLVASDLTPLPLDDALFAVEESAEGGMREVTFRYRGPAGDAEKRFVFNGDETFGVEIEVTRPRGWGVWFGPGLRNPAADEADNRFNVHGAVYRLGAEVERLAAKKAEEPVALGGDGLSWVGLEDRYFLTALIPDLGGEPAGARLVPMIQQAAGDGSWTFTPIPPGGPPEALEKLPREIALVLEPEGSRLATTAYWGAKYLDRLAAAAPELDQTVNLGMFGWASRFLLLGIPAFPALDGAPGLEWIHGFVGNYGWSIILLTVLIKLVLLPLTHKSYVSMRKMQALQPRMQAIREKYRPKQRDKKGRPNVEMQRKMNEEIMALYKSEGVNPAGGCLPMLLQLPVLFAFYRLLYNAVELRGAPWILWVTDLSEPFWPLAIIMGATQFLQQRMTPMAGDPMQRRIFQLMPVFMTILFIGFPSGLVLYWLTNNVLTIGQQAVYNRVLGDPRKGDGGGKTSHRGKKSDTKSKGGRKT